ncbi:MAG TPA: LysR substrate-binding domain-containing protein [Candidatus Acidoferrales bacterium]|nr:LysR substrate-binding domain-containing protein [Candidatus Acidoferrales bacterium]
MELHQLRYFCAVARAGTFTRAARAENVSQPSLSQQVLKLEAELGAKLFDRFPRSARLTRFGQTFLARAEAILRQVGAARTEIQEMAGDERGTVTIGAIPTIAPYLLPPLLASFARRHPAIAVSVVEDTTPVLLDRLHDGRIDLALLALPVPGDELACEELFREPLYAVVPARHRLASKRRIDLQELGRDAFLLMKEGHCFRDNVIGACRRSKLQPRVVFESGQFSTILAMVTAGMGVSVVPAMAIERRPGCRFLRVGDGQVNRRVGLAQLKHHFPTVAHRALVQHLRRSVPRPAHRARQLRPAE